MAYKQWTTIKIYSENATLKIKNAGLNHGKFHKYGDQDHNLSVDAVMKEGIIESGKSYIVAACGLELGTSGTEGWFDLYDGDQKLGTYTWDCPYSGTNRSHWNAEKAIEEFYAVTKIGGTSRNGALEAITLIVTKIA